MIRESLDTPGYIGMFVYTSIRESYAYVDALICAKLYRIVWFSRSSVVGNSTHIRQDVIIKENNVFCVLYLTSVIPIKNLCRRIFMLLRCYPLMLFDRCTVVMLFPSCTSLYVTNNDKIKVKYRSNVYKEIIEKKVDKTPKIAHPL